MRKDSKATLTASTAGSRSDHAADATTEYDQSAETGDGPDIHVNWIVSYLYEGGVKIRKVGLTS